MNKYIKKYHSLPRELKATLWFTICSFIQKGISEVSTPIFTRILTTDEYGQYSYFNSWLNIITVIVVMKLYAGVYTQGLVKHEDDRNTYISSMQGLALSLCLGWTVIYLCGMDFWNRILKLTTPQMLCMMVMIWATSCFNLWATEQRVALKYKSLVIITTITSLAKPVVGVVLVLLSDNKVMARIFGLMLVELVGYSFLFFVDLRKGKKFFSAKYWKLTLAIGLPLIPHYLCQTALNSADRIMIKNMIGDSEAGIYSLAYSISQIVTLLTVALVQSISPWIGKKIKSHREEDVANIVYISLGIVAFANIALIAFAPEIIWIFGPKSYHEAIWVMPPVAMSVFFSFFYSIVAAVEIYYNKTRLMSVATMIGAGLNLILNYIFLQIYGYFAAGYTTLVCFIFYAIFHYVLMKKAIRDNNAKTIFDPRIVLLITMVFMTVGFVYLFTYYNIWVRYGLTAIILILVFIFRRRVKSFLVQIMDIRKKKNT